MFRRAVVALIICAANVCPVSPALAASRVTGTLAGVRWQPAKLVPGSPVLFQLPPSMRVKDVTALWFGHEVTFFRPSGATAWSGLAAVPLETAPGTYELVLHETSASGKSVEVHSR